jgi:tyrosyl-tRNA synthetase
MPARTWKKFSGEKVPIECRRDKALRQKSSLASFDSGPGITKRLAFEATCLAHGEEEARRAEGAAAALFGGGDVPEAALRDAPTVELAAAALAQGIEAFDLFHRVGLAKSRGEARRLIAGGGAYVGGRQLDPGGERVTAGAARDGQILLRAGKKKYLLLKLI